MEDGEGRGLKREKEERNWVRGRVRGKKGKLCVIFRLE